MPELGKDDRLISRKEAAKYLQDRGMAVSYVTLMQMGAHNNARRGPPFWKDGNRCLYSIQDLELWRRQRLRRVE